MALKFQSGLINAFEKKDFWSGATLANNEKLTNDSGFVPLDIRFKKLDIATAQRKLALSQFDYRDYDELFDDDIIFSKYDSLEELQAKVDDYTTKKKAILARKFAEFQAVKQNEANAAAKSQAAKPAENPPTQVNSDNNSGN